MFLSLPGQTWPRDPFAVPGRPVPTGRARKTLQSAPTISPGDQLYGHVVAISWSRPEFIAASWQRGRAPALHRLHSEPLARHQWPAPAATARSHANRGASKGTATNIVLGSGPGGPEGPRKNLHGLTCSRRPPSALLEAPGPDTNQIKNHCLETGN